MFLNSIINSAWEAWLVMPLVSLNLPAFGFLFYSTTWGISVIAAMLAAAISHSSNHLYAHAGSSAVSSLRKQISGFWSAQVLERVNFNWRTVSNRSGNTTDHSSLTNRLVAGWLSLSGVQRKTTYVWVVALFYVLLVSNSFGLVPLSSAITGQAGLTLGLSLALWIGITLSGMQRQKSKFVQLFLPSGPSWPMAPLFVMLESISYTFRAISLGVRLWANMLAGHQLLHLFGALALVPALTLNFLVGAPITMFAALILMALSGLEVMVCVLQSGVFCLLASFYLNEVLSKKDVLVAGEY
jgi:ATP synthase subunit 6